VATYNLSFGLKTRVGCGEPLDVTTLSGAISGTGASDWALTARGSIAPAHSGVAYLGHKSTWALGAGQTYNLTVGADTVNITMLANRADVTVLSGDTASSNQLRTVLALAYNAPGALVVGDTVMVRDGTLYDFQAAGLTTSSIALPTNGYGGFGTITNPGSGYTSGIYPISGGSGANGRLYILASGGQVQQAAVMDPGNGLYQAGDVVSVTGGGGSNFAFTVIDFNGRITIRSETEDTSTLADGNLRRGGGATFTSLVLSPGSTAPRAPIDLKYLDFWLDPAVSTRTISTFFAYRDAANGYGVNIANCNATVPDEVVITTTSDTRRIIAFENRLATVENNYLYRVRRGIQRTNGPGTKTSGGVMRADDTIIRTIIRDNVLVKLNGDGIKLKGRKLDVTGNFYRNPEATAGAHQDMLQIDLSDLDAGVATDLDVYVADNVGWVGNDSGGEPQGALFMSDPVDNAEALNITIENNTVIMSSVNGIAVPAGVNPIVRYNTVVNLFSWPEGASSLASSTPRIMLKEGEGGLVDQNITSVIAVTESDGAQVGVDVTARNTVIPLAASYAGLPSLTYSVCTTKAQVLAKTRPLAGLAVASGGAMNPDGTYNGDLFPDGTKNDGTVYQATPPSLITSSAPASAMVVNQTLTITFQLDAAANQAVTITPAVSGVSGSFSAATVEIGVGQASGTVNFTPTTAGTASITCTNNRSLTNPTALTISVTTAGVAPTAYTQAADRTAVSITGSIVITYTLNQPADTAVTITPAVSGVAGAFSSPTVVIPNGQTTGSVSFFPGGLGNGTLTATDDSGLTDPAGISITVTQANAGQMLALLKVMVA